jgi:phage terminase small subunit
MKLNRNKEKAFIREYLKDSNGKKAAIRAGYSKHSAESQASRLLSKAKVKEELAKKMDKAGEKAIVDLAYVIKGFKEVAERCLQKEAVMEFDYESKEMVEKKVLAVDPKTGEEKWVGVYKFDAGGANKALECLGKHLGAFIEKHELKLGFKLEDLVAGSNKEDDGD